jgi:hypothetical protein
MTYPAAAAPATWLLMARVGAVVAAYAFAGVELLRRQADATPATAER